MQPMDANNKPVGPLEPLEQERLKELLETEGVDHVDVRKIEKPPRGLHVGDVFTVNEARYTVTKVLSRGRIHLKETP